MLNVSERQGCVTCLSLRDRGKNIPISIPLRLNVDWGQEIPYGEIRMLFPERAGINTKQHKEQGSTPGVGLRNITEPSLNPASALGDSLARDQRSPPEIHWPTVADGPQS